MASDENSNMGMLLEEEDDYDHDTDDGYCDHHLPHQQNLSRLSVCTSSIYSNQDDDYQDCDGMAMFLSRLSIESFDADEELSDNEEETVIGMLDLSSDSDKELPAGSYSLPETPPTRRRNRGGSGVMGNHQGVEDYASENEAHKGEKKRKNLPRKRNKNNKKKEEESENGGVVVITTPKGGNRPLCMDLEEVKACRDLGFELEHEAMLEMPCRPSLLGSTTDTTSSGGNSPIANWRISSPGDDPRDVKARLKLWAQAVAIASVSKHGCF